MARDALRTLARLYGVMPRYVDSAGTEQEVGDDALLGVLRALGAPLDRPGDATDAVRARRRETWSRALEPVTTLTSKGRLVVPLRVGVAEREASVSCEIALEDGETIEWTGSVANASVLARSAIDGEERARVALVLPHQLPFGYHDLRVRVGDAEHRSLLISAPLRASAWEGAKAWGVFMPLYALRSTRSWGAGDLTDMREALAWLASMGGKVFATLPLLATFLDEPYEQSPYSPASRLFWSELYLDPESSPDLDGAPEARELLASGVGGELEALRGADEVDHRRVAGAKRRVLEALARAAFATRGDELERYARETPELDAYARFRAMTEAARAYWTEWDEEPEAPEDARRYHVYVQWLAERQLRAVDEVADATLLFDLPVGVHPGGFDAWRFRSSFASGVNGGAPPDSFFSKGQDWGFAPLHPERIREEAYAYPIAAFRALLRHARVLRIDHVMGLHRLWWIPPGMDARDGAYVRYRHEELYAILALESHRTKALIVGEDLGTVPPEVRTQMRAHTIHRTYVVQEELRPGRFPPLNPVPEASVATVNTHDMPTFAAWWQGLDVAERVEMGLFDDDEATAERERRGAIRGDIVGFLRRRRFLPEGEEEPQHRDVLVALVRALGRTRARLVVASLEDLWGEERRVNTPGTPAQLNWRRPGKYTLEQMQEMPEVLDALRLLDRERGKVKGRERR